MTKLRTTQLAASGANDKDFLQYDALLGWIPRPGVMTASVFLAKGDLIVATGSGAYTRLPVGADGKFLTPDSTTTTGLKWQTLPAGIAIQDENVTLASNATQLDFQGAGVTATVGVGGEIVVTIPGSGAGRTTATYTTASLPVGSRETGTLTLGPGYRLYQLVTSAKCRVRFYSTTAKRDADLTRTIGTDPPENSGLMLEYVATAAGTYILSPLVDGYVGSGAAAALTIDNTGVAPATITVTVTYVETE